MKTLEKYEMYSDEYTKEIQRENAYFISIMLQMIAEANNISEELRQAIISVGIQAEKEVGEEEITVGIPKTV